VKEKERVGEGKKDKSFESIDIRSYVNVSSQKIDTVNYFVE
jgi:hypothetical protein